MHEPETEAPSEGTTGPRVEGEDAACDPVGSCSLSGRLASITAEPSQSFGGDTATDRDWSKVRAISGSQFVYVIAGGNGLLKVGITGSLRGRLSSLQCATPEKLSIRYAVSVAADDAKRIEALCHSMLSHSHVSGEWFGVSADVAIASVHSAMRELGCCELPFEVKKERKREKRSAALSFRLSHSLRERLERMAAKDRRPLSSFLEMHLEDLADRLETRAKRRQ